MNIINANQGISQKLLQILAKASLENLNAGDILQGRVQSLDNGMLLIKLMDGTFFNAKVPEDFSAASGELITLEIGDRINDQLTAKILPSDSQKQQLSKANAQTLKTLVAEKLTSMGETQPEKLVDSVLSLLKAKPELPVDHAALLTANKLDASPEMMALVQKISEHEFQLHENLQFLKDGIKNTINQMDRSAKQAVLKPLILSEELDKLAAVLERILPDASTTQKASIVQQVRQLLTKTFLNEMAADGSENSIDSMELKNFLLKAMNAFKGDLTAQNEDSEMLFNKPENIDKLLETVQKVLQEVHTRSYALDKGSEKEAEALIESLFEKAVIKVENGKTEEVDIREKAQALKEIMDFSQKALSIADGKAQASNLPAFKEIDNAFRFFNQVTTYDSMVQLPIRINKENTTGELYVMKRRNGRKKLDADNFTLFLSLQTTSLGRIESFLNSSRKYVTISFRVEDEALVKLVKDHHRDLYDHLLTKGYKLAEMKCRILEDDPTSLVDAAKKAQALLGLQARLDIKL